jgi:hypothetical protein
VTFDLECAGCGLVGPSVHRTPTTGPLCGDCFEARYPEVCASLEGASSASLVERGAKGARVPEHGTPGNGVAEPNSEGARSARTLVAPGLLASPKLRVLDIEQMLATEPEPVPWIVEPLLAQGCVTMLAGREGQGKSMLALALASAIGHGSTVAGLECQPGTVVYVDAENGKREAHRRVRGLGVKPGTLVYVEAVGFSLTEDIGLLAELVDEHRPSVVVLDSLRSLAPGLDENDSRPAEAALRPVSRLAQDKGLPILLLAHAGKQGIEYRGSTAIGAAVEIGFTLSRHEDDPEKRTRRKLACWKSRPAPEPPPRWIALESRDGMVLLGETEPFEASRSGRPSNERDETADVLLAALNGQFTAWADWARAAGLDPKNGTARRAREELADAGLVRQAQGLWLRANTSGTVA